MEKCIQLIRIPLMITGFDIFIESNQFRNKILRLISCITLSFMQTCFWYTIVFDNTGLDLPDKIYIYTGIQAYIFLKIQLIHFWYNRGKIVELYDDIEDLHKAREESLVEKHARPLFRKNSAFLSKFCK